MSFILDALRRAEAERQRGQAPGLQQITHQALAAPARQRPVSVRWILALLLTAAAGAAGAWWWSQARRPDASTPVAAAAARIDHPASTPAAASQPPPAAATTAATPAPAPRPARPAASAPAPAPAPAPAVAAPASVAQAPAVAASTPASAPAPRPVLAANLPEPLRGAVLRLQVGGVVHSQDRSQSFVMVGGQIAREGETLSPGITLERIAPRSLLLRVAGLAVELPL